MCSTVSPARSFLHSHPSSRPTTSFTCSLYRSTHPTTIPHVHPPTMDFQLTAAISLFETIATAITTNRTIIGSGGGLQTLLHHIQFNPTSLLTTFLSFFLLQYLLLKFYRVIIYPHFLSPLRHLPGPKEGNLPLLGQFVAIWKSHSPFALPLRWGNQWPKEPFIRYLGLGNEELLVMNTPEAHKAVLQTYCYDFVKPGLLERAVGEFVGKGILFTTGAEHRRLRRILQNPMSIPTLKRIMPTLREGCVSLTAYLNREIGETDRKVYIDAGAVFGRALLDLTGMTVLGVRLENLRSENPKYNFMTHYHRIFDQSILSGLITLINTTVPIRRFIPLEANRGYQFACSEVKRLTLEVVRLREREVREATLAAKSSPQSTDEKSTSSEETGGEIQVKIDGIESHGRDMLTMMIQERKGFLGTDDEMTDLEICDQLLILIVGSHETTASSLTWAMYVLVTRPDIQERLRQEIFDFITETGTQDGSYTYSQVESSLPYLQNFTKEIMRRYCPVTASWREAARDITICDTFIPKGTAIHFLPPVVNFSKAVWGDDAEEFRPERWDELKGEAASPYAFMAFSHGPRICIGRHAGSLNFKLMVMELLVNFRFGISEEIEEERRLGGGEMRVQNPGPSLRPRGRMMVSVERLGVKV